MDATENSRWIIGESLETLGNAGVVCVVHTRFPRMIGTLQSRHGQIELTVQWCETHLAPPEEARLCDDVMRYFVDYNVTAYGHPEASYLY